MVKHSKPLRQCTHGGCRELTQNTKCPKHETLEAKESDSRRGTARERGYDSRWSKASRTYLRSHPICQCLECKANNKLTPATVVDHIIPHRGDMVLFWDTSNWQSMSKRCHDRKTATHDGAFGHERREYVNSQST